MNLKRLWQLLASDRPAETAAEAGTLDTAVFEAGLLILRLGAAVLVALFGRTALRFAESPAGLVWLYVGALALAVYVVFCLVAFYLIALKRPHREHRGLNNFQVSVDLVFAAIILYTSREVGFPATLLCVAPMVSAAHHGSARRWLVLSFAVMLVAFVSMVGCTLGGGQLNGIPFSAIVSGRLVRLLSVVLPQVAILGAASLVLRLYRVSHEIERERVDAERIRALQREEDAIEARRKAEEVSRELRALQKGTKCGITVLRLNGSIESWNEKHEEDFAPLGAKYRKEAGLPCYSVFHNQKQPCRLCGLKWKRCKVQLTAGIELWNDEWEQYKKRVEEDARLREDVGVEELLKGGPPEKWRVHPYSLERKVEAGRNWAISNQLRAGEETEDRLHLYYIYYGAVYEAGEDGQGGNRSDGRRMTRVVESVTEITEAVLEMPFLLGAQHDRKHVPPGLPPIGVVSASRKREVLEMNRAKLVRCQKEDADPKPKEDLLNLPCVKAYQQSDGHWDYCDNCPVEAAIKQRGPAKRLTHHPGKAMVTAVPLFGCRGEVRAVFEFIDDISELVAVEETGRELNALGSESDVLVAGISALRKLAKADRCVLMEFRDCDRKVVMRGEKDGKEGRPLEISASEIPLAGEILEHKRPVCVESVANDKRISSTLRRRIRWIKTERPLGPVLFIPILRKKEEKEEDQTEEKKRAEVLAIAVLGRYEGEKPFEDEEIIYCQLLTGHLAAAMARARELDRRKQLIEAMKQTADLLSPEIGVRKLVETASKLFPEEISLVAYLRGHPPTHPETSLIFVAGAGTHFRAEAESHPEKWKPGREASLTEGVETAVFVERKAQSCCVPRPERRPSNLLVLDDTHWAHILPFVYRDQDILGCLVAESPREQEDKAFPEEVKVLLQLVAEFGSIVLGRSELLNYCMLSLYGHELGSPLTALRGLAGNVERDLAEVPIASQNLRDLLQFVDSTISALRVAHTTWRIAAGEDVALDLNKNVDPVALVEGARDTLLLRYPRSCPVIEPIGDVPSCRCDPNCIKTAVFELLSNAFKFREEDTNVVASVERDENRVRISVTNAGSIPTNLAVRVFEAFYRLPAHRRIPGSGLGLWRAATLVRAHPCGEIAVNNLGPPEVTFSIWLPSA